MSELCAIRGRILSVSGEPLRKTEVALQTATGQFGARYECATGPDGVFVFADIPPGQYRMTARRTGYVPGTFGGREGGHPMMGTPLTVTAGGALEGIEVRMAPQAVITGTVLDEDGDPLEGVRVMLLREIDAGGGKQLVPAGTQGSTDDRGHFRIAGIAPGAYCLSANPEGWGSRERAIRQGPEQTYPEMFYPGTRDPDEAQSIQVAMGAQLSGFELRLIPAAAYRVRGRIEMPEAVPPFPIMIRLDRDRYGRHAGNFGGGHGGRMMQTGGAFDLGGVLPGSYTLMVNCQAGGRQRQAAIEVEVIDRNVEGIVVTFPEGFALRGVVRPGPGGADVPMGGIPLSLHSPRDPRQQAQAHTDSNGAFTILDLPPGRYRVNVFPAPRDGYVQSVRYGASEWKDGCIDLQPEAEAALQVVLAFDTGEVSGTVVDASGRPVPGGTVRLLVDRGSYSDRDRMATSDQNGRFHLRGIPPGEYVALAAASAVPWARPSAGEGVRVTVAPQGHGHLDLLTGP